MSIEDLHRALRYWVCHRTTHTPIYSKRAPQSVCTKSQILQLKGNYLGSSFGRKITWFKWAEGSDRSRSPDNIDWASALYENAYLYKA